MIKADQVAVANASAPCLNPSLVERRLPSHHPSQQHPYVQLRRVDHASDNSEGTTAMRIREPIKSHC